MLEAGVLPAYLPLLWKKANGYDPQARKKLTETWRTPLRCFLFGLSFGCLAAYINGFFGAKIGSIPHWTFLAGSLVFTACFFLADRFLPEFCYSHGYEFWRSISWLFHLSPMRAEDFPTDETELNDRYQTVMKEMAQLVLLLEDKDLQDEARRAKLHLECLHKGAQCFGFVRDPKQGLKPYFDLAKQSQKFHWVFPSGWLELYGSN